MSTAAALKPSVRCTIEIVKGPHAGLKLDFEKPTITIGRDAENDVSLSKDPRVSRQHAEIKQDMGQFQIVNLSQRNFVLINGTRITTERVSSKDLVQIGETEFRFFIHDNTGSLEPVAPGLSEKTNVSPLKVAPTPPVAQPTPNASLASVGSTMPAQRPKVAPTAWAPAPAPSRPIYTSTSVPSGPNGRVRFYAIVGGVLLLVGIAAMKSGRTQRANEKPFITAEEMDAERQENENEIKAFKERQLHMQSVVYQKAYENFLRGYRDYRQGQYSRAMDAFQLVLNLDPGNDLAKHYYELANNKFDALIKFNLRQGRSYLEKQNYRMCKSNFQTVMTMLTGRTTDPDYIEAKSLHERCASALEGRF